MTRSEKILFILAMILAVAALVLGAFSTYFGVSAQIARAAYEAEGNVGNSLGVGFLLVFMLISFVASAGATLFSTVLFLIRPIRSRAFRVRRASRTAIAVMIVLLLVQCVFLVLGIL